MILTTQEAIEFLMDECGYDTYLSIAKHMTTKGDTNVQPIQVSYWHKGQKRMSKKNAD